jgi:hypothetical protein
MDADEEACIDPAYQAIDDLADDVERLFEALMWGLRPGRYEILKVPSQPVF